MRHIALFFFIIATSSGCATLAEQAEGQVPAFFGPEKGVVLEQGHAVIPYRYCVPQVGCVDRVAELQRFDLTLESGETISCLAMRQYIKHVDDSENDWIFNTVESDPRCEAEMERLATLPNGN